MDVAPNPKPAAGEPHPSGESGPSALAQYGIVVLFPVHLRKQLVELTAEPDSQFDSVAQELNRPFKRRSLSKGRTHGSSRPGDCFAIVAAMANAKHSAIGDNCPPGWGWSTPTFHPP